jgi:hypothetical protein
MHATKGHNKKLAVAGTKAHKQVFHFKCKWGSDPRLLGECNRCTALNHSAIAAFFSKSIASRGGKGRSKKQAPRRDNIGFRSAISNFK